MLLLVLCVVVGASGQTVTLPGPVEVVGTTGATRFTGRQIYKFTGIPYAEPPIGENRFMRPKNITEWPATVNATQYGRECPQIAMFTQPSSFRSRPRPGSKADASGDPEDCLTLDIYTPQINNGSLPVLFHLHGGSFIEGSSDSIQPEFLLEYDVVLVAPQYRLGPLGFLTLETTEKTGNAALYDVLMALKFVYENIEYFGGDPSRITVSGISAGSAIASLLYVSPLTQDLISQVMLFSGSGIAPWVIDSDPVTHSQAIAGLLGCNRDTGDATLACLQNVPNATDIIFAYFMFSATERKQGRHGMAGTIPIVDGEILTELPLTTLSSDTFKAKPVLISTVKNEGMFLTDMMTEYFLQANDLMENTEVLRYEMVNLLMVFSGITDPSYTVSASLEETYFSPEVMGDLKQMTPGIIDFLGATFMKGPALKTAELNSQRNGTTFLAAFNYDPDGTGVDHNADQMFIFPWDEDYTDRDLAIVQKATKLYAQFVINGAPTGIQSQKVDGVEWTSYTRENKNYVTIDDSLQLKQGFEQEFAITEVARRRSRASASTHVPQQFMLLLAVTVLGFIPTLW